MEHIEEVCRTVLDENEHNGHTMPAPNLYPHQWLWDTCFTSIGIRHYDPARAKRELLRLIEGQWSNGMIPHMIFEHGKRYRQDRDVWRSKVSPYSPDSVATSGITQPPVLAEAVARVGEKLSKTERLSFYKQIVPSLFSYHLWLMRERDPHKEGLVLQIHPWETGLDNTPPWMNQLHEHSKPWWIAILEKLRADGIVNLFRRDTRHVPPGQRITNTEALMVFDMIRRFRRKNYDITKILHRSLFCIEDVGFNSILARNNTILLELADKSRIKVPIELREKITKHAGALQQFWDEQDGFFYSRDFITHELIKDQTIASLLPIYSGVITKEQAGRIVDCLKNYKTFGLNHPIPSVPLNNPAFSAVRYWQGPSWTNTNWLIIDGLERYGFSELANTLKDKSIELVELHGPYEYFSPIDGQPLGASEFSWTAALTLDLIRRP